MVTYLTVFIFPAFLTLNCNIPLIIAVQSDGCFLMFLKRGQVCAL